MVRRRRQRAIAEPAARRPGHGGQMSLLLAWKTATGNAGYPVASINVLDGGASANDLNDSRTYMVEDQPGPITSWWQKWGAVSINNILDQQNPPAPYTPYQT